MAVVSDEANLCASSCLCGTARVESQKRVVLASLKFHGGSAQLNATRHSPQKEQRVECAE